MTKKGNKNNKRLLFGAFSAAIASLVTGVAVKKTIDKIELGNLDEDDVVSYEKRDGIKPVSKKVKNNIEKIKRSKNVYYTVNLNDIYDPYSDKTMSEEDMINEFKRETSL